jgi:O-antigen/teichoic acid export membrane protein
LIAITLIPFAVPFFGIVVLALLGHVTVGTAAAVTIAGSLLAIVPGLPLLKRRPTFNRSLARDAVKFGVQGWLGGLALIANLRLDQFMMITAVSPSELGLYAVATTVASAPLLAIASISPPLMTRVAAGDRHLVGRAVRMAMNGTVLLSIPLAAITPGLIAVVFGSRFIAAVPMALLLMVANIPLAGAMVLSSSFQAEAVPMVPTIAEGMALVITVVGLLALLGPLGGIGAALVSIAAYGTSFTFQLTIARRHFKVSLHELTIPTPDDVRWARRLISEHVPLLRSRTEAT